MFKKSSRRNFQGRSQGNAIVDDNDGVIIQPKPQTTAQSPAKPMPPVVNRIMEPDADNGAEDSAEFQIKKSRRSQKLAEKQREAARRDRYIMDDASASDETTLGNATSTPLISDHEVMSGEVAEQAGVYCGDSQMAIAEHTSGVHEFRRTIQGSRIPNAKLIFEAKRQRQIARLHGDVIPIGRLTKSDDDTFAAVGGSRLLKEENSDHSDDEGGIQPVNSAVRFMAHSRADILRQRAEHEAALDERIANLTANDEDDEWEREQLKKVQSSVNAAARIRSALAAHQTSAAVHSPAVGVPPAMSMPASLKISVQLIQFSDMKERVGQRLHAVHDVLTAHKAEQTRLHAELDGCRAKINRYNEQLPQLAGESDFYKEITDYVHSALECYSTKADEIERVVDEAREIRRVAHEHCVQARKTCVKDMDDDVRTVPTSPLTAEIIERRRRLLEHEKVVEQRRQKYQIPSDADDEFVQYDDVESKLSAVLTKRDAIFSDTHEDFYLIPNILSRFVQWYTEYPTVYDDAYVDECVAKLLVLIIKWNMAGWVPWTTDGDVDNKRTLSKLLWFLQVQEFSDQRRVFRQQQMTNGSAHGNDADKRRSLVQLILENVVFQVLSLEVYSWDPYSTEQTQRLVGFLHSTVGSQKLVSADHPNVVAMVENIKKHAVKVIADTVYFPLYPRQILDSNAYALSFYNKQFWSISKLFGNLLKLYGILPNAELKQIAVTSLLNRYLLMPLRTARDSVDTLEKACRLDEVLPQALCEDWCMSFDEGTASLQELSTQCYAVAKANIERLRKNPNAGDRSRTASLLERLASVLKKLKDFKSVHLVEKELLILTRS